MISDLEQILNKLSDFLNTNSRLLEKEDLEKLIQAQDIIINVVYKD